MRLVKSRPPGLAHDAEQAAQRGDLAEALREFVAAGDRAAAHQAWRSAARCYRGALEVDLLRREPVARLVKLSKRIGNELEWGAYARVLDEMPDWPRFGCRAARVVAHDDGSIVECSGAGPVLELIMSRADRVEVYPDGRFAKMPLAMAMLIVRRALWTAPRRDAQKPARMHVVFGGREPVWLDERGDWGAL
jgi:hypothetical protein